MLVAYTVNLKAVKSWEIATFYISLTQRNLNRSDSPVGTWSLHKENISCRIYPNFIFPLSNWNIMLCCCCLICFPAEGSALPLELKFQRSLFPYKIWHSFGMLIVKCTGLHLTLFLKNPELINVYLFDKMWNAKWLWVVHNKK